MSPSQAPQSGQPLLHHSSWSVPREGEGVSGPYLAVLESLLTRCPLCRGERGPVGGSAKGATKDKKAVPSWESWGRDQ